MPDPLDFDGARRALDDVPAPDLWADASQRAEAGAVVPLPAASGERARRPRWLVAVGVAAVAVLAVGTAAALLADDDQSVDTTPTTEPPAATGDPTTVTGGVCTVGITGEPIVMDAGPAADPPRFDPSGQPANQLVAHTMLGSQVAELHVPGVVLTDLVGERVEDVELERGTASIWFGPDFVQVRWFPGGQELCESFTVTVSGGSEDANRHAAVAFAERVLLPSDLGEVGVARPRRHRVAARALRRRGEPTEGTGSAFTFADGEATGPTAATASGPRTPQPVGDLAGTWVTISSTERACPMNATTQAIGAVMGSDDIRVTTTGSSDELLVISSGDDDPDPAPACRRRRAVRGPELAGTEWRVVGAVPRRRGGAAPAGRWRADLHVRRAQVAWDDDCNSARRHLRRSTLTATSSSRCDR